MNVRRITTLRFDSIVPDNHLIVEHLGAGPETKVDFLDEENVIFGHLERDVGTYAPILDRVTSSF